MSLLETDLSLILREPRKGSDELAYTVRFTNEPFIQGRYASYLDSGLNGTVFKPEHTLRILEEANDFALVSIEKDPITAGWVKRDSIVPQGTVDPKGDIQNINVKIDESFGLSNFESNFELQRDTNVALLDYNLEKKTILIGFVTKSNKIMKGYVSMEDLCLKRIIKSCF
jgi:hypothetical protein